MTSPPLTWLRAQPRRAAGFGLLAVGAAAVTLGWLRVSGASTPEEQLSSIVSAGLGSLLCLGTGMTLLLDAGLRDEQRKLAELARFTDRVPAPEPGFAAGRTVPVLLAGGLAAVIVGFGWNRAAGAADPRGAVPGVAIGIAGVAVLAVVTAVHLVRMRAAVEGRKAAVLRPLADRYQATLSTVDLAAAPPAGTAAQPGPATVLVAPGITRFHRTGCPTLTDVAAVAVRRGDVDPGLRPCQICEAGPR